MRHGTRLESTDFEYKHRTVSVGHVQELRDWLEKLRREGLFGQNEVWRRYINNFVFEPDKILPGARSLIILSIPLQIAAVTFYEENRRIQVLIPTGYVDDLISDDLIGARVRRDIVRDHAKRLKINPKLPLKTLAVKSGLAQYGKNNISFVEGYGSFHRLVGIYTDQVLEDNWVPLKMMRACKGCSICVEACPTKCIREEPFVIDVDRCITLYNELTDPLPEWIDPKAHNALVGCLKCQYGCPANTEAIRRIEHLADINAKETELILRQGKDKRLHESIIRKLKRFPAAEDLAYLSRNLSLVLANMLRGRK
jgi:epoxyqueuosine reductase